MPAWAYPAALAMRSCEAFDFEVISTAEVVPAVAPRGLVLDGGCAHGVLLMLLAPIPA